MEKKRAILTIVFALASCCRAWSAAPAAPAPVTVAAAAAVTGSASAGTAKTASDEDENLMEVKLKEFHFNITPEFQFVLPDASLRIGLKQKMGDTYLDASTEYNYLYNKMRYDIKYNIDLFLSFSANLYDAVNFEQVYQNLKYIQRNKGFGVSITGPEILDFFRIREELKDDNYYFAQLDHVFIPSTGSIIILNSWLEFDLTFSDKKMTDQDRLALTFDKSVPSAFSSYNFLFLDILFDKRFNFDGDKKLDLKFRGGYILQKNDVPIWQVYRLGGYDSMMGYNYDEFEGNYMDFIRVKYETPLFDHVNLDLPLIRIDTIRMFVDLDMGSASYGVHEVVNIDHYHYSAALGLILEFTFRKRTAVKMTFALAQAIQQGKMPVFYFAHEF